MKPAPLPADGRYAIRYSFSKDGFGATYITLRQCIEAAYHVPFNARISGPEWLASDSNRYTISAKASSPQPEDQLRLMLQNLLADRFQLKLHTEDRDLPVYALVVGNKGVHLQGVQYEGPDKDLGMRPTRTGLEAKHASMALFANFLSGSLVGLDRPVIDQTKTQGLFDFTLEYAKQPRSWAAQLDPSADSAAPLIFTAIEELGLKLEPRKASVKFFVVDQAQRVPREN